MSLPLGGTEARPLRRDAVRNQQRVLDAARVILSEHGTDATMELIAAQAGVGVGTVYRHFPTKDVLIDELVQLIMSELVAAAGTALERTDGRGLEVYLRVVGRSFTEHRAYSHLLVGRASAKSGVEHLRQLTGELLAQAQQHGRIGPDIGLGDVMATVWAIRGIIDTSGAVTPRAWQRHLDLHLAALRSTTPLSDQPVVTARQLARITNGATTARRSASG